MPDFSGSVSLPGLARLVQILEAFADGDARLRLLQAQNAPQAKVQVNVTVDDSTVVVIDAAQSGARDFAFLLVAFDENSGAGRYSIMDGVTPLADGSSGLPIVSGGGVVQVQGSANIKAFQMIAETGQSLNAAYVAFI